MKNTTIEALIEHGKLRLFACSDSALLDAKILLCKVLNKELTYLLTWPDKKVEQVEIQQYLSLLSRRELGEPIAYITGVKEFWSLPFAVSEATLIPRPDTEILVEEVLENFPNQPNVNCLDLGTGTGAIALALASENPMWKIHGVDYSQDAVKLAQENASNLSLTQVDFYQSDWFSNVDKNSRFDVIVSNPPYIDEDDVNLSQGDVRFEPKSALVADNHGLADIELIALQARGYFVNNGKIFFEHGFDQASAVSRILKKLGYTQVKTVKDLSGHDRITWANYLLKQED